MRIKSLSALAAVAVACCAYPAVSAAKPPKELKNAIAHGASYIASQVQSDGSFGEEFGGEWALSALAAAKVAPVTVKPGTTDARTFYRELIGDPATWPGASKPVTAYENAALAAYAAGIDPARVSAEQNLIAQIVARYQTGAPGYYGSATNFNGTAFALLALAETKTKSGKQRVPQALLEETVAIVRGNQHTDGGWTFTRAEGSKEELEAPSEAEFTGAAMASLCSAGVSSSDPAITKAISYLEADLAAETSNSGAFATEFGPNTDTNAWAVRGLNACGVSATSASFTTPTGNTPVSFLLSQQLSNGGFGFEGEANLYSTQDAVSALAGAGFTVAPAGAKGEPKWVAETSFSSSPSVKSELALVIDNGSSLGVCAVTIAPAAAKTTLAAVLTAAESAATPAGCVTSFAPTSGKGAITQVNGVSGAWQYSIDDGKLKTAKPTASIGVGDTVYLKLT
jgi:Prenyltransferase and squalene oxidase repeat